MTKYVCDLCGKEVNKENKLKSITFNSYHIYGDMWFFKNYELCKDCVNELNERLEECKENFLKEKRGVK